MNLVTCCTPIGREDRFQSELNHVFFVATFFRRLYPDGRVFLLTTPDADIPQKLKSLVAVIRLPFAKMPFAIARQLFYKGFCESKYFDRQTFFIGSDVILCKKFDLDINVPFMMTYRYHPTAPYCSDLVLCNHLHQETCVKFFSDVEYYIRWMPKEIQSSWADQLSIAITIGYLGKNMFDGKLHQSPNLSNVILAPGDDYLFTPNDFFPSLKSRFTGEMISDTNNKSDLRKHFFNKFAIHYKGNRKNLFFLQAKMAVEDGVIVLPEGVRF